MKKLLTILLSIIIAMAGYSQSPTKGALNTVDTTWKPTIKMLAINKLDNTVVYWNLSYWTVVETSSGGGIPTWQQTLTAGSTLNTDNTIDGGGHSFIFQNAHDIKLITDNSPGIYIDQPDGVIRIGDIDSIFQSTIFKVNAVDGSGSIFSADNSSHDSHFGINTTSPDSTLTVVGGIYGTRGLRLSGLPNDVGTKALRYNPTTGLVSYADTTASSSGSSSLTNLLNINQVPHSGIVVSQDSVIIFGDSYVVGTGATSAAKGWAPVLSSYMNAILDNRGVDGTTLEKRTPVDWVGGAATNMIDLLPTVPVKTAKKKLLIIALALNDWGYNGGQYNPVNYKTDYDSVMNYITNTKGWPAKNVLIIPPYWIGAAGRTQYAGLSGNSAPTYAQALVFIDSTKAVANQWGTLYFDIYHDQYNNDTTLFNGGNPIHPDDSGFLYIARDIYTYLAPNIQLWKQNTTNEVMPYFATNTPASTTTPASINLGASYASSAGLPGSTKLKLYYDGTANNTVGFGVSTAGLESNVFPGGTFDYYVGAYKIASFGVGNADIRTAVQFSGYGAGAATFDASGNITSVSDMRLKNLQGYYHGGLTELMNITPIIYKWKPGSGMETTHDYIGFSAQNIKSVLGEGAYGVNSKGYLSIQDRAIMATMVNAIQELQKEVNDLKQQIKNK